MPLFLTDHPLAPLLLGGILALTTLSLFSAKLRGYLKRMFLVLLAMIILATAYFYLTGESITQVPNRIIHIMSDQKDEPEPTHRYYQSPDEELLKNSPNKH